ncbi:spore germination protein [Faecalispora anaeroviscerum]|uniref:spore germination protein n=1 Tax=Faecalispora anaeroviscerum TaxID=2991836 RepID=UPI0024BBC2AC|nr:spore germination protein [Faecalispora anaeroviscerum]
MIWNLFQRKIGFYSHRNSANQENEKKKEPEKKTDSKDPEISDRLEENLTYVQHLLGNSGDIKIHRFCLGKNRECPAALLFVDGLINQKVISDEILYPILSMEYTVPSSRQDGRERISQLQEKILCSGDTQTLLKLSQVAAGILSGDAVILVEGCAIGLGVSAKGWEKRGVTEPETESVVRGPREGFTENFRTNTSLLRRKIKSPSLRMEQMTIGRKTLTNVCISYLEGVARPEVVNEVRERLKRLDVDSVLDSGYLEEYIEDAPFSIFSTVGYTEKPDVAAAKILEGRVAIIADGSPFVLTAPLLFIETFQSAEDYYIRPLFASLLRILRYIAYNFSVFLPAIYIALTTFHQELIPTTLLLTIASAREGTPFPAFLEALLMIFAFEVLREAGLRLPRPVGQAVSIVGALIMGDAAVSAGLVGAPMVITIALTSVAGFVVPEQNDSMAILRLITMVFAAALGGYGICLCFLGLLVHLGSLSSFGTTYFNGFSLSRDLEDGVIRMPLWVMTRRPARLAKHDMTRRRFFIPPNPRPAATPSGESGNSGSGEDGS